MNNNRRYQTLIAVLLNIVLLTACSKTDDGGAGPNPCTGITITASATAGNTSACLNSGSITVTASGSSGLTYSIDGRSFQSSNIFANLAKGTYTVTVKNENGCTKSVPDIVVGESGTTAGTRFTEVKQLLQLKCVSCHAPGGQQPVPNFTIDCNIVTNSSRIRERAVVLGTMPPGGSLTQAEKDVISAWITAGGRLSD
jgi:hypothetical protein